MSPPSTRTCSRGRASSSATIWPKTVRAPWPTSVELTSRVTPPSASMRTIAVETGCAPAASSPTLMPRPTIPAGFGDLPIETGGDLADVPDEIGIEWLAAGADGFAAVEEISLPDLQGVQPAAAADLVDLQLAAPLQVTGPEGAVGTGGGGVGVDAPGVDLAPLPSGTGPGAASAPVATTRGPLSA